VKQQHGSLTGVAQILGLTPAAVTMKQYVQTDLEADRKVANTLAELIIGGALASTEVTYQAVGDQGETA
jgi:predicted transcriptional regulator